MATTDQQNALKDAMARAKQIAAKLQQQKQSGGEANATSTDESRKRNLVDSATEPAAKRNILGGIDPADPKLIAQQVANSLVQKAGAGLGYMLVEECTIPNKLVGLVIGRGGEMINKLQSESGAKVQVAPDPPPEMAGVITERQITITGTAEAVSKAKALIEEIRAGQKIPERLMVGTLPGEFSVEMMIAKGKVGLIIGKGGETIKSLQERAGCKMVLFQDGVYANSLEKPLRISGEQSTVMYGKQLVQDLLTSKELEGLNAEKQNYKEMDVPREAVGLVIGAKGANIQQIQTETGCRVQFKNDMEGATKTAMLTGNPQQLAAAEQKLMEIINANNMTGSRGTKQNWGSIPNQGGVQSFNGPVPQGPDGSQWGAPGGQRDMIIEVPANKCGLVIGKGGETIKYIHNETKVDIEINRDIQDISHIRVFRIRGTDEMIQNALVIIREKTSEPSIIARPADIQPQNQWGPSHDGNILPQHQQNQQWDQQQQQQWPGQQQQQSPMGQQQQSHWAQPSYEQQGGWNQQTQPGTPAWNQHQQPPQPAWDPQTQQWQQPNPPPQQVQWSNQQQQWPQQGQSYQPHQNQPSGPHQGHMGHNPTAPGDPANTAASQSSGQPDYSAAWADYYRQQQQQQQQQQHNQQQNQYYPQYGMQQPVSSAPGGPPGHRTGPHAHVQTPDTPTSSTNSQGSAMADYQAKLAEYYKSIGQHPPQ